MQVIIDFLSQWWLLLTIIFGVLFLVLYVLYLFGVFTSGKLVKGHPDLNDYEFFVAKHVKGVAYKDSWKDFAAIDKMLKDAKIPHEDSIGIYYNDPKDTPVADLEFDGG
ncbi:hypothetical protein ADUPG1_000983, partial [Aduncisulcus paluster]